MRSDELARRRRTNEANERLAQTLAADPDARSASVEVHAFAIDITTGDVIADTPELPHDRSWVDTPVGVLIQTTVSDFTRKPQQHHRFPELNRLLRIVLGSISGSSGLHDVESRRAKLGPLAEADRRDRRWANAAMMSELKKLATAREGERNSMLNNAALALGEIVAGGLLTYEGVRTALTATAEQIGLEDAEIRMTIESGMRAGKLHPRRPQQQRQSRIVRRGR
ncbi:MAG: hypothetical protein ACR2GX_06670 [Candidatus Dormibacteria bacterium]